MAHNQMLQNLAIQFVNETESLWRSVNLPTIPFTMNTRCFAGSVASSFDDDEEEDDADGVFPWKWRSKDLKFLLKTQKNEKMNRFSRGKWAEINFEGHDDAIV